MAAPEMKPVKNLAFIRSADWIDFDLIPEDVRNGEDCFHFVDIPSERPSGDWTPSTNQNYPSDAGWVTTTVIHNGISTELYWNDSTGEHAAIQS